MPTFVLMPDLLQIATAQQANVLAVGSRSLLHQGALVSQTSDRPASLFQFRTDFPHLLACERIPADGKQAENQKSDRHPDVDLPDIRPTIDLLETKAGFRIAPALRENVLQAAGE